MCTYAAWCGEASSVNRSQGWDPPKAACSQAMALPLFTSKLRSSLIHSLKTPNIGHFVAGNTIQVQGELRNDEPAILSYGERVQMVVILAHIQKEGIVLIGVEAIDTVSREKIAVPTIQKFVHFDQAVIHVELPEVRILSLESIL